MICCVLSYAIRILTNSTFFLVLLANLRRASIIPSLSLESRSLEDIVHHFSIDRRDRTGTDYSRRWWEWGTIAAAVPCSSHMSNQTCRHNRPGMYFVSLAPPIWSCVKQGAHDHCHDPKGAVSPKRVASSHRTMKHSYGRGSNKDQVLVFT